MDTRRKMRRKKRTSEVRRGKKIIKVKTRRNRRRKKRIRMKMRRKGKREKTTWTKREGK